jgi:hypothetical protein
LDVRRRRSPVSLPAVRFSVRFGFQGLSVFRVDLAAARVLEQWFCVSARWNGHAWDAEKGWYRAFPERDRWATTSASIARRSRCSISPRIHAPGADALAGNDMPEQTSIADLDVQIDGSPRAVRHHTARVEYWQKDRAVATPW